MEVSGLAYDVLLVLSMRLCDLDFSYEEKIVSQMGICPMSVTGLNVKTETMGYMPSTTSLSLDPGME